jgi:GT2 family glycosyltransferase
MFIRFEEVRGTDSVLVISETDKFLGEMLIVDLIDCVDKDKDILEEDNYVYWSVDKNKLNEFLKK